MAKPSHHYGMVNDMQWLPNMTLGEDLGLNVGIPRVDNPPSAALVKRRKIRIQA
jgi:hypothetical protein